VKSSQDFSRNFEKYGPRIILIEDEIVAVVILIVFVVRYVVIIITHIILTVSANLYLVFRGDSDSGEVV